MESMRGLSPEPPPSLGTEPESPLHGFQGDRARVPSAPAIPAGLTIAISREAGSRGGTIARRVGRQLGWQVYNQELLEYIAQEGDFRQDIFDTLSPAAATWVQDRLAALQREFAFEGQPSLVALVRVLLALGATGQVILTGRGAGYVLPRASTLHVRIMAPREDRVAYMAQWLRLTPEEAARQVDLRDARRAEFLATHFKQQPADIYQYDLLLNSSLLGEEHCASIIVQAARGKLALYPPPSELPPPWGPTAQE